MQLFSKPLSSTDVRKRLAIPAKALPFLLPNGAGHAVKLKVRHGAGVWPFVCSTRRNGYKKPVFQRGWKRFVLENKLNVGDIVALYKDQEDETGRSCSRYRIEVMRAIPMDSGAGAGSNVSAGKFSGEAFCNGSYSGATTCEAICAAGYVPSGIYSGEATYLGCYSAGNYPSPTIRKANCAAGYVSTGDRFGEGSSNATYSDTTTCEASCAAGYVPAGNYSGEGSSKANCMNEDGGIEQFGVHEDEEVENFVPFKLFAVLVAGILPPVVSSAGISEAKVEVEFDGINLDLTLSPPKMKNVITIC